MQPDSVNKQTNEPAPAPALQVRDQIPVPQVVPTAPLASTYFSTPTFRAEIAKKPQRSFLEAIPGSFKSFAAKVKEIFNFQKNSQD